MPPKNPWVNISWKKTIADCDQSEVKSLVVGLSKRPASEQIHNEMLPEPFIGDLEANVYLLNGNPGVTLADLALTNDPTFLKQIRTTLCQTPKPVSFMWLIPATSSVISYGRHSGYNWWRKKLSSILKHNSDPKICNIEYFPYHSFKLPSTLPHLPSNDYVDWYIDDAIKKKKWIIILRCKDKWLQRIPNLMKSPNLLFCCNPRNVCVSENNLCDSKGTKITTKDWNNLINAL